MAGVVIRVWSDLPYCIPVTDHCSLRKPGCGQIIRGILTGGSNNSRNLDTIANREEIWLSAAITCKFLERLVVPLKPKEESQRVRSQRSSQFSCYPKNHDHTFAKDAESLLVQYLLL